MVTKNRISFPYFKHEAYICEFNFSHHSQARQYAKELYGSNATCMSIFFSVNSIYNPKKVYIPRVDF